VTIVWRIKRKLQELFCAILCTTAVQLCEYTDMNSSTSKLTSFGSDISMLFFASFSELWTTFYHSQFSCLIMRISSFHCRVFSWQHQCKWSPAKNHRSSSYMKVI